MPWVSNRSGVDITVSITNTSGGSASSYKIQPAILYMTATATAPESSGSNYWTRKAAETLTVTMAGSTHCFQVQPNDHVNIYTNSYETYPAHFGWFKQ
jgi:hypothetical protein